MLVDAYHSKHILPLYVVQPLDGLAFPFFVASLVCVDRVLVTTMRPCRLQQRQRCGSTAEAVGVALFVVLTVVIYARAALVQPSTKWIVAVQAVFVTWSLTLFFLVLGRCCELRRTGRRADAVRSLLTAYVRLKRHLANGSENSASSGRGSTAAGRRYLRMLRRQIETVSYDGGFPMTSHRRNRTASGAPSSSSSSSDFVLSTDSFRAILSHYDSSQRQPSDCAAVDGVDPDNETASGAVRRADGTASGSEPDVQDVHRAHEMDVGKRYSPTRCSQQTWVFFDNRSSAVPEDQLLAEIASASGRRVTSGFERQRPDLRKLWRVFGNGRRRLYEYLRAELAEWLGISGQLRLMTQHPPRRLSKSRLARSRSRASNISAGQRFSNYNLAQPVREFCGPDARGDIDDRKSQMVTSSSRLSESTCTELSLLSVPVLTGNCPTDDGREISHDDETGRHDTGYAADTEPETIRYDGHRLRWSRDRVAHSAPSSDLSDNSTSARRIELPASTSRCLRMRRHIPDVTLLRRAMWTAITVALATLSVCTVQVYAALGIYGVLSNERIVQSVWAWLVFQSLAR